MVDMLTRSYLRFLYSVVLFLLHFLVRCFFASALWLFRHIFLRLFAGDRVGVCDLSKSLTDRQPPILSLRMRMRIGQVKCLLHLPLLLVFVFSVLRLVLRAHAQYHKVIEHLNGNWICWWGVIKLLEVSRNLSERNEEIEKKKYSK